jgi:hypothetical protein
MNAGQDLLELRTGEDRCRGCIPAAVPELIVQAALQYAVDGWPVFPCRQDKKPLTINGFKDASTDPDQIRAWWKKWPSAMIGTPLGREIFCVDLDRKENGGDGVASWEELEGEFGRSPNTLTHQTPSTGQHLFSAHTRISATCLSTRSPPAWRSRARAATSSCRPRGSRTGGFINARLITRSLKLQLG